MGGGVFKTNLVVQLLPAQDDRLWFPIETVYGVQFLVFDKGETFALIELFECFSVTFRIHSVDALNNDGLFDCNGVALHDLKLLLNFLCVADMIYIKLLINLCQPLGK